LAILTDEGSASASEIVSGSLQDLDRAVIIGQNTYGKGLVQITRPIAYKARLKVTISKYYIPSGRCIQRIDYSHRNGNGEASAIPDSLRKDFKTKNGRIVKDGAGIEPDIKTNIETLSHIATTLYFKNLIFDYANKYHVDHLQLRDGNNFALTEAEYNEFAAFLQGKDYDYTTDSEQQLEDLKKSVKEENFSEDISKMLTDLEDKIKHDKAKDLVKYQPEIKRILEQEIVSRYAYEKGRIANGLRDDPDVIKAIEVLSDPLKYQGVLTAKK
jgi:carboxyl-terminal processing protease